MGGTGPGVEAAPCSARLRADAVLQRKLATLPNVKVITSALTTEVKGDGEKVSGLVYKDRNHGTSHEVELEGIFLHTDARLIHALGNGTQAIAGLDRSTQGTDMRSVFEDFARLAKEYHTAAETAVEVDVRVDIKVRDTVHPAILPDAATRIILE